MTVGRKCAKVGGTATVSGPFHLLPFFTDPLWEGMQSLSSCHNADVPRLLDDP